MSLPIIRSGYDVSLLVRVRKGSANEDLSTATIKASLVDATKTAELITDTAQANSGEADWTNGLVEVIFTAAQTTALTPGKAFVEVAITLGGLRFPVNSVPVEIEKGWTVS